MTVQPLRFEFIGPLDELLIWQRYNTNQLIVSFPTASNETDSEFISVANNNLLVD